MKIPKEDTMRFGKLIDVVREGVRKHLQANDLWNEKSQHLLDLIFGKRWWIFRSECFVDMLSRHFQCQKEVPLSRAQMRYVVLGLAQVHFWRGMYKEGLLSEEAKAEDGEWAEVICFVTDTNTLPHVLPAQFFWRMAGEFRKFLESKEIDPDKREAMLVLARQIETPVRTMPTVLASPWLFDEH